jgi:hypothetical protein
MRRFVLLLMGLGILTIGLTSASAHAQKKRKSKTGERSSEGYPAFTSRLFRRSLSSPGWATNFPPQNVRT